MISGPPPWSNLVEVSSIPKLTPDKWGLLLFSGVLFWGLVKLIKAVNQDMQDMDEED